MRYKTFLVFGDTHIPYHDMATLECIYKLGNLIKPDKIFLLGDIIDMWQLSKFAKEPSREFTIDTDIETTTEVLKKMRDFFNKSEIIMLAGNHEDRLRKYKWSVAKELTGIKFLHLENMLELDKLHIKYYPLATDVHQENALLFTHGTVVSQDSGATARRMLRKYGMSIIHGHTHRLGSHYVTDYAGSKASFECGCTCKAELAKAWSQGLPNWQNGCSVVYMFGQRFDVKQVFISKGQCLFGGEEIRSELK